MPRPLVNHLYKWDGMEWEQWMGGELHVCQVAAAVLSSQPASLAESTCPVTNWCECTPMEVCKGRIHTRTHDSRSQWQVEDSYCKSKKSTGKLSRIENVHDVIIANAHSRECTHVHQHQRKWLAAELLMHPSTLPRNVLASYRQYWHYWHVGTHTTLITHVLPHFISWFSWTSIKRPHLEHLYPVMPPLHCSHCPDTQLLLSNLQYETDSVQMDIMKHNVNKGWVSCIKTPCKIIYAIYG